MNIAPIPEKDLAAFPPRIIIRKLQSVATFSLRFGHFALRSRPALAHSPLCHTSHHAALAVTGVYEGFRGGLNPETALYLCGYEGYLDLYHSQHFEDFAMHAPRLVGVVLVVALLSGGSWAMAADGDEALQQAIDAKREVKSFDDLERVIDLCEEALDKGLEEADEAFAKQLLASTLLQRGAFLGQVLENMIRGAAANPALAAQYPAVLKQAIDDLKQAIEHDADMIDAYIMLGQLNNLPGGDKEAGLEALNTAVERTANSRDKEQRSKVLMARAGLQTDADKRLEDLNAAVEVDDGNADALRMRALAHAQKKNYEDSLKDLDAALVLEEDNAAAYELKGLILAEQKKYDEAIEVLNRSVDLDEKNAAAYAQRGRVRLLQGEAKEAIHDFDKALLISPTNTTILLLRAQAHAMAEDQKRALADVEKVLAISPNNPQALQARALIQAGKGNFQDALPDLKAALEGAPQDPRMLLQLGILHQNMKQYDKALDAFNHAIEASPEDGLAYQLRGDLHIGAGEHSQAIKDYDKALELDPENTSVLNNLAWLLATSPDDQIRDGKRAVALAEEACRLTEYAKPHILSTLAAAFAENNDFEAAVKWSTKAVEMAQAQARDANNDDDVTENVGDQLEKELESYKAGKPWRERQSREDAEEAAEKDEAKEAA